MNRDTIKIYVELLDEGTATVRGTMAENLGEGLYKVLPVDDYDPEDEIWAFLPGSTVRLEKRESFDGKEYMRAIKP